MMHLLPPFPKPVRSGVLSSGHAARAPRAGTRSSRRARAGALLAGLLWISAFGAADSPAPLRILPLGDSITRGTYLVAAGATGAPGELNRGRPNSEAGGWRKVLQDRLRAAGIAYDFVGSLNYHAFGRDGVLDPAFDPDHHGLAGFGNRQIIKGGRVPTPAEVLAELGVTEVVVPGIVEVLEQHRPHVILLMSGTNGFDANGRDELIRLIVAHSRAHLFVATIPLQQPPREGWEKVDAYNASLPAVVAAQNAAGHRVTLVPMHEALGAADLQPDGVHPNREGLRKMGEAWFDALRTAGYVRSQREPSASR